MCRSTQITQLYQQPFFCFFWGEGSLTLQTPDFQFCYCNFLLSYCAATAASTLLTGKFLSNLIGINAECFPFPILQVEEVGVILPLLRLCILIEGRELLSIGNCVGHARIRSRSFWAGSRVFQLDPDLDLPYCNHTTVLNKKKIIKTFFTFQKQLP